MTWGFANRESTICDAGQARGRFRAFYLPRIDNLGVFAPNFRQGEFSARKKDGEAMFSDRPTLGVAALCGRDCVDCFMGGVGVGLKPPSLRLGLMRHVHRSDAARIVFPGHINKAGVLHKVSQPLLIRKRLDAFRQIYKSLFVARDQTSPEGNQVLQVEIIQRTPHSIRRRGELQAC